MAMARCDRRNEWQYDARYGLIGMLLAAVVLVLMRHDLAQGLTLAVVITSAAGWTRRGRQHAGEGRPMRPEPAGDAGPTPTRRRRRWWTSKWLQPAIAVTLGLVIWAAFWAGGDPGGGVISFAILAGFGLLLLLGGRSDTVRGMRGDGRDERWAMIDLRATALAGSVVIMAIIVGFVVEIARGHDGNPYTWLGALAGVAYVVGLLIGRYRS